jgi:rubrerythrin
MSTRLDLSKLSLMDALDLAILIEMEAYERYKMFASQLGRTGGYDPGAFFASMAENEAKHGSELAEQRKELFGDAPAKLTLDDLYDVEATLQAFELGLAAEQKAYDFYDAALPGITDPEVIKLFTELRDEETEHVEMLKEAMAKLPESARTEVEYDLDETPYL